MLYASVVTQSLVFTSTNIRTLTQLNALASMRRLDNLTINGEGNPLTKLSIWRPYVVFRLAHFSLKHINGSEVGNRIVIAACDGCTKLLSYRRCVVTMGRGIIVCCV